MRFKLSLVASRLSLHPHGVAPLVLSVRRSYDLNVTLRSIEANGDASLECIVETEFEPNASVVEMFDALASDRLPAGHLPRAEWPRDIDYIDAVGGIRDHYLVPLFLMPPAFQTFASQLSAELFAAAEASVGVLRWRSRTLGPRQPFATRGAEWSVNGDQWHALPSTTSIGLGDVARLELGETAAAEMQALLDSDEVEPLAHVLFREAWSQRLRNPRSSLLIGMTALEVGIKHYIASCVPAARWLAENVPTPPVIAMLEKYLPSLVAPGGRPPVRPFDKDIIDTLKVAVSIRNGLAHQGADVPPARLTRTLRAVRNVLWTLDAARGHEWAARYVLPSLEEDHPVGYRRI